MEEELRPLTLAPQTPLKVGLEESAINWKGPMLVKM